MPAAVLPMEALSSSRDGGVVAFQPSYRLTPKMLRQLKAIEQTTGFLRAVSLRSDWMAEVKSRTLVQEALASLQIEGNSLTLEEAFALARELPPRDLRNAEREFCNYLRAFDAIDGLRGTREAVLSKGDLCNLHRLLVDGVRGGWRGAGEFRREEVKVGDVANGRVHVHHHPPAWLAVEACIDELLAWVEASKVRGSGGDDPWVHPVILAGIVQHRLVWIHPFVDGNGRTARMLTTLLLSQRGYDFKYLFQLSTYYNQARDDYYAALRGADVTGDYTEWLTYFLGGFSNQMMRIEEMARGGA